ncbi:MAG: TauD/TfdA family dioxygenase [Alphaproteobacteria bacterium]|nr:TauD/TfdA family dioxygenase [Alphaproteobacteria bacterium]
MIPITAKEQQYSALFVAPQFDLSNKGAYQKWRDSRLESAPNRVEDLLVEVGDIANPTPSEHAKLVALVAACNMAVTVEKSVPPDRDDKNALRALGRTLGLESLDGNHLADDDGITPLAVHRDGIRSRYIPYTERPIAWHTDGYYNAPSQRVRGLLLYCARPAAEGGANKLMDPEALYIALRDEDPALVAALMRPDAMTIPPNEDEGMTRPAMGGPVFFVEQCRLQMRYTARTRSIEWHADPLVQAAAAAIRRHLDGPAPTLFQARLESGWGLVSNNVLHTREPFKDDPAHPRLLYRARYHDRISGT